MHELFGVAPVSLFEHLGTMTRAGQVVNFKGEEAYLSHIDGMKIPIAFVYGEDNETWLPESTRQTDNALCNEQRSCDDLSEDRRSFSNVSPPSTAWPSAFR